MTYLCPHCGDPLPDDLIREITEAAFRSQRSDAGKTKTAKKTEAQKENMARLNAAYTPAKRKATMEARRKV